MTLVAAAAATRPDGRVRSAGHSSDDTLRPLPSDPVSFSESLAQAVARAGAGMTNTALAHRAGVSTRTLRAILDPSTPRRFGRATLDKLDGPLGWPAGRAWQLYRRSQSAGAPDVGDDYANIRAQMDALAERMAQMTVTPPWAAELIDVARTLSPADRATLIALAHRLARG